MDAMHEVKKDDRRPYSAPRLAVYGDLRAVTLTNFTKNMNDPGNSSRTMT